jgi:cytochrome c-type biogenesis protein CcmH/NrfG
MAGHAGQMPTLEQMKRMADKKAEPLLAKMRTNPNDPGVLIQIGNVYRSAHQFKDAVDYYGKALQLDPRNVAIRTELASCLYYTGDIDGALAQLHQGLETDPKDSNSLFNLGMIEWREKKNAAGALAAWNQLLKANPSLAVDKKSQVQKLIAEVKEQSKAVKN